MSHANDRPPSDPRKQHYTPRMLQRGFANERKRGKFQAHVFDKQQKRSFVSAIEDIAAERDYNTLETGPFTVSWESKLTYLENLAAPVIDRIRQLEGVAHVNEMDLATLCMFTAMQLIRGPAYRAQWIQLTKGLEAKVREVSQGKASFESLADEDQEARQASFDVFNTKLEELAGYFVEKDLVLFKAPGGSAFLLGDCPVAMTNDRKFGPYGNLGLAVPGIQINLPISSQLAIAFWCPSLLDEMRNAVAQSVSNLRASGGTALIHDAAMRAVLEKKRVELREAQTRIEVMLDAQKQGRALPCSEDNVRHLNSLQVLHSERFVVSIDGNFALVEEMLAANPEYATGRRMTFG